MCRLYEYFLELLVCFVIYMQKSSGLFCMNYKCFIFIVTPCILKIHWILHTNKCTNCTSYTSILLLQSALQPLWVMACSSTVEYSQQEGFYRVPLPAARQPPNLEDQWLERSNSRHQASLKSEMTRANPSSGRWNYGREISENFAEIGDFHVTFGFIYMP